MAFRQLHPQQWPGFAQFRRASSGGSERDGPLTRHGWTAWGSHQLQWEIYGKYEKSYGNIWKYMGLNYGFIGFSLW